MTLVQKPHQISLPLHPMNSNYTLEMTLDIAIMAIMAILAIMATLAMVSGNCMVAITGIQLKSTKKLAQ